MLKSGSAKKVRRFSNVFARRGNFAQAAKDLPFLAFTSLKHPPNVERIGRRHHQSVKSRPCDPEPRLGGLIIGI